MELESLRNAQIVLDAPYLDQPYYVPELQRDYASPVLEDGIQTVTVTAKKIPWPWIIAGSLVLLYLMSNRH